MLLPREKADGAPEPASILIRFKIDGRWHTWSGSGPVSAETTGYDILLDDFDLPQS